MRRSNGMGLYEAGRIVSIQLKDILPNPAQPRKQFDEHDMRELTYSIARYGVLQPLSVRRRGRSYELVAGERRLRAARAAGLEEVPCVVLDVDAPESEIIALMENIQRRSLDFVEEAEGLSRLVELHGFSRKEAAARVGMSLPALANKLRLLRMPRELLYAVRQSGLSERHARALLRLGSDEAMAAALEHILRGGLTVAQTEEYIDGLVSGAKEEKPKPVFLIKDVRFFLNTVTRGAELMRAAGVDAQLDREETDEEIVLNIHIPKM